MRGLRLALALILLLAVLAGCGRRGGENAVARVGGSSLTIDELYASIPEQHLAMMSLEDQEEAVGNWVKTELFYQEGLREGIGTGDQIERRLREIERELIAEEYIKHRMSEVPDVTDEEAAAYFGKHQNEYAIQVRLAHILVRNRPEAERAHEQILKGTPFETVASSFSIDQTASMGGDLGYMRRGEMIHELEETAFGLKVGEVSDVITSGYGYHILKVLDRHPGAGQPSFESKRSVVLSFLTSRRRREAFDSWLLDIETRSAVHVDTLLIRQAATERMRGAGDPSFVDQVDEQSGDDVKDGTP